MAYEFVKTTNVTLTTSYQDVEVPNNCFAMVIQCRESSDMLFVADTTDTEYYTIKSGSYLAISVSNASGLNFAIKGTATNVAEIIFQIKL